MGVKLTWNIDKWRAAALQTGEHVQHCGGSLDSLYYFFIYLAQEEHSLSLIVVESVPVVTILLPRAQQHHRVHFLIISIQITNTSEFIGGYKYSFNTLTIEILKFIELWLPKYLLICMQLQTSRMNRNIRKTISRCPITTSNEFHRTSSEVVV